MYTFKRKNKNPSPISERICECECNFEFQPNRVDQKYLNSKHANFAYNHGKRKEKYFEEKEIIKLIRKNDRIAEKYHNKFRKVKAILNFDLLKAEGFDSNHYSRIITETITNGEKIKFHALFNYCYRLIKQDDLIFIEIQKL
jgi:hypothetical protein